MADLIHAGAFGAFELPMLLVGHGWRAAREAAIKLLDAPLALSIKSAPASSARSAPSVCADAS